MQRAELPYDDALRAAGRLAVRTAVMFRLWIETAGAVGRAINRDAIDANWEHLRFLEHGQLVACVVGVHNLLAGSKDSLTIARLIKRGRGLGLDVSLAEAAMSQSSSIVPKLSILRHNAFAHSTAARTYDDVFKDAAIASNEVGQACLSALAAVNELLVARGFDRLRADSGPEESYRAMLSRLMPVAST